MRREAIVSSVFLIILILAGPGCLMNISATSVQSGVASEKTASASIVKHETTRAEVIEQLGEPVRTSAREDGSEVLVYEGVLKESATFSMLFLINFSSKKTRTSTTTIVVHDGIVIDVKREQTVDKEY